MSIALSTYHSCCTPSSARSKALPWREAKRSTTPLHPRTTQAPPRSNASITASRQATTVVHSSGSQHTVHDDIQQRSAPEAYSKHDDAPDWVAYVNTTIFLVGLILIEYGVWDLLDEVLGDSVWGSIFCVIWGLGIIFYIRLKGLRVADIFSL